MRWRVLEGLREGGEVCGCGEEVVGWWALIAMCMAPPSLPSVW